MVTSTSFSQILRVLAGLAGATQHERAWAGRGCRQLLVPPGRPAGLATTGPGYVTSGYRVKPAINPPPCDDAVCRSGLLRSRASILVDGWAGGPGRGPPPSRPLRNRRDRLGVVVVLVAVVEVVVFIVVFVFEVVLIIEVVVIVQVDLFGVVILGVVVLAVVVRVVVVLGVVEVRSLEV